MLSYILSIPVRRAGLHAPASSAAAFGRACPVRFLSCARLRLTPRPCPNAHAHLPLCPPGCPLRTGRRPRAPSRTGKAALRNHQGPLYRKLISARMSVNSRHHERVHRSSTRATPYRILICLNKQPALQHHPFTDGPFQVPMARLDVLSQIQIFNAGLRRTCPPHDSRLLMH